LKTWIISDTHFGHNNILKYEPCRIDMLNMQSNNINEMNERLIEVWNETVKPEDLVYHLGDVSFGHFDVRVLNGRKFLVTGNHDADFQEMLNRGWSEVLPERFLKNVGGHQGIHFLLTHRPVYVDKGSREDKSGIIYNIHGHLHSKPSPTDKHICVSVEQINCRPIELNEIIDKIKARN
jgi:calcineurin-like phosphoesterase family protein